MFLFPFFTLFFSTHFFLLPSVFKKQLSFYFSYFLVLTRFSSTMKINFFCLHTTSLFPLSTHTHTRTHFTLNCMLSLSLSHSHTHPNTHTHTDTLNIVEDCGVRHIRSVGLAPMDFIRRLKEIDKRKRKMCVNCQRERVCVIKAK